MNSTVAAIGGADEMKVFGEGRIKLWLAATGHVCLARRYLFLLLIVGVGGALAAMLMRLELMAPGPDLFGSSAFAMLFSAHGTLMFYFVLAPAFLGVLGNALLPGEVGARGMAFPRLNALSWYLLAAGGFLILLSAMMGGLGSGWTFEAFAAVGGSAVRLAAAPAGVALAAVSLILLAVNQVTTVLSLRDRAISWGRMPVFSWSVFLAGLMVLFSSPLLALSMGLILGNTFFGISLSDPATGGDPLLMRRLFWMYGTPALYAVALPALGLLGDAFARKARGPDQVVKAILAAIALPSFLLWGQHFLNVDGLGGMSYVSAASTSLVAGLFLALVVHWIRLMAVSGLPDGEAGAYETASLALLLVAVLTGLILGLPALNRFLHNTYFMTAHVHVMTSGALFMAFVGGLHRAWQPLTERMPRPGLARSGLAVAVIGLAATFGPLFLLGVHGAVRRQDAYPAEFQVLHILSTAGASILLAGITLAALSFALARRRSH
jgi:cytochrome c oxidase subunit 1